MCTLLVRMAQGISGGTAIEYALIAGIVSIAIGTAAGVLGSDVLDCISQ